MFHPAYLYSLTEYLCKTEDDGGRKSVEKGKRKDSLPEVPVFFQKACVFFQKACVFFQILALQKLHIYAMTACT